METIEVAERNDFQGGEGSRRTLVLRAELAGLDDARRFLRDSLRSVRMEEEELFKLEVALVEICVNIIRYAYPDGPGEITISLGTAPSVWLEIRDSGRSFDPRLVPTPDLDEHLKIGRRGGLGVYLARSLVDDFDYRREGGGNIVTLRQRRPQPAQ